jgi:signal transduction histidine kinase
MARTLRNILLALFLLLLFFQQKSYAEEKNKTIVIFFSMSANLPAYQNFLEGFRNAFSQESDGRYNLIVEYLDAGRSQDDAYVRHIVTMYNEKLKNSKIDLIIAFPPLTYSILEKYGLTALNSTPVIMMEPDPPFDSTYTISPKANTLQLHLKFHITQTLNKIFELFPDNKDVYIINGNSFVDRYFASLVNQSTEVFTPFHRFIYISGISLDSTIQIAGRITENSIVIIPMYLTDSKNISFSTPEAIGMIANHCKAPVFPLFDSFIKTSGGIGGYVFSYTALGKETGRISREVLDGINLQDIRFDETSYYRNIYDWQQLKKWHLLGSRAIPANSIFINKDFDFFSAYKWQIYILLMVLISETFLIIYLYRLNRRQKEIVRQKTENESLYRELIREDRLSRMSELTASLSHELNQPLTAILYNAQAGKRFLETGKLDDNQASEIFENIIEDDKRAGSLISSVRSLMKLETREKEKVNLKTLIPETVNIFNAEAVKQHIQISFKSLEDPVLVFGDKIQLQQVLLNFMSNAAIAMKNDDPANKRIEITQKISKDSVIVSVRDSGPGIEDSIKDKIFRPFVTSSSSGFGVGLAVSRSIIRNHNGEIMAENIQGGGAEFSFKLHVYKDENL